MKHGKRSTPSTRPKRSNFWIAARPRSRQFVGLDAPRADCQGAGKAGRRPGISRSDPDSDPISGTGPAQGRADRAGETPLAGGRGGLCSPLGLDPSQIQAYRELAYLYALQRRKRECDAVYHELARRKDLDYILAFAWCQNTCQLWDPGEARKVLTGFLAKDPSDRFSRLALAASYQLTNEQDEAEKAYSATLQTPTPKPGPSGIQLAIDRGEREAAESLAQEGPADCAAGCASSAANWPSTAPTHHGP